MTRLAIILILLPFSLLWANPQWDRGTKIPEGTHRENIFDLPAEEFKRQQQAGFIHALRYPVEVSGLFIPYEPLKNFLGADESNPLKKFIADISRRRVGFGNLQEMYDWIGLNPFNDENATGIYQIPYPDGKRPDYPMGASLVQTEHGLGLSFSCATCHSANLFGTTVMGLTNKRVRANEFFHTAKKYVPLIPSRLFQSATGADEQERQMFKRTKYNLGAVGVKSPEALGLDTSLGQVALSLARRLDDEFATKSPLRQRFPRYNPLAGDHIADSKPMVWWNLKYKNRWLADGSIVSGNPILTNFLWNEIGRGTDLEELEDWMERNESTIKELTVAAFSTKPPPYTDFFGVQAINLEKAKRGQKHFQESCQKCHGDYQKAWDSEDAWLLPADELVKTTKLVYHEETPIKNVGTDPGRYEGTKHFASRLNELRISKWMKTVVEPQEGYVPPPLDGIWSRYPYFHNNSIPNLCALLTPPSQRPKTFWQGPAVDKERDFDQDCVGYPVGEAIPSEWKEEKDAFYDTRRVGMSNQGHYKMLLHQDGSEKYDAQQKSELIEFLKTL